MRDDIFEPRGGLRVRLELWLLGLLLKTEHMRKPNSELWQAVEYFNEAGRDASPSRSQRSDAGGS